MLNETNACGGNVYFEIWGTEEVQLELTKLHTFLYLYLYEYVVVTNSGLNLPMRSPLLSSHLY